MKNQDFVSKTLNEFGDHYYYGLTFKYLHERFPSVYRYQAVIKSFPKLFKRLSLTNFAYELDSKGKLHLHVTLYGGFTIFKKFFNDFNRRGWHVHMTALYTKVSLHKWDNYLLKENLSFSMIEHIQLTDDIKTYMLDNEYPFQ